MISEFLNRLFTDPLFFLTIYGLTAILMVVYPIFLLWLIERRTGRPKKIK